MSLLYLHIPYCKRICAYCDFFRSASLATLPAALDAMRSEMERRRDYLGGDTRIRTIYFGGGTPSLCAPQRLQRLIDTASGLWDCSSPEEITVEVNPDDVTDDYVAALRDTAVDRISLGIQSFDDGLLRAMNRRHTAAQAVAAVERLRRAGYDNLSGDLIFGIEGFGGSVLEESLRRMIALGVCHISAYHLTIEPGTAFGRRVARGLMHEVDEAVSEREFALVHDMLTAAGYEHYEVSNFALPGCRARHNSAYWTGERYLGIGAGAHSFDGAERRWCTSTVEQYAECDFRYQSELLSDREMYDEYVMTSLRRIEGIDTEYVAERFGRGRAEAMIAAAARWQASGDMIIGQGRMRIPPDRFLISDAVIESLFE